MIFQGGGGGGGGVEPSVPIPSVDPPMLRVNEDYTVTVVSKKVSEYDQEIPQLQTADNPMAPRGRATQPSRDTRKTN